MVPASEFDLRDARMSLGVMPAPKLAALSILVDEHHVSLSMLVRRTGLTRRDAEEIYGSASLATVGSADVVFTDPPYAAPGMRVFATSAAQALRGETRDGRVVIAFGHSGRRPDLGRAAQRELLAAGHFLDEKGTPSIARSPRRKRRNSSQQPVVGPVPGVPTRRRPPGGA